MNPRLLLIAAIAFGAYVLGAKAGRGRYQEIVDLAQGVWNDPHSKKARKKIGKVSKREGKQIAALARKKKNQLLKGR